MENDGVIYISSGDEIAPEKEKCHYSPNVVKPLGKCKVEINVDTNEKSDTMCQKRKASQITDSNTVSSNLCFTKKIKMTVENALIAIDSLGLCKEDEEQVVVKPKLIVKERISLPDVEQDTFPQFISLCLQKDRSEDMKLIVNKLKRRYEQLDPTYATSKNFITLLNEKRDAISNSDKKLYIHISDVMNDMKRMCKKNKQFAQSSVSDNSMAEQSGPSASANFSTKTVCKSNKDNNGREKKDSKELKMILNVMKQCEKRIAELEEEEVDFDEETDSSYMKVERYKRRMVELWNRYCELTGENPDAGRPYLRPKHLSATHIVAVDQAITNFINSQISQKNKLSKKGGCVSALIFPDYADILDCIYQCNISHNLGLDKKKQQQIAKRAFIQLGEHLQRVRRNDYWDTFSLFLEDKEDDPASKNVELAEKLHQNRRIGEKKLAQVFEDFVRKQDLRQAGDSEDTSSGETDEESESCEDEVKDVNNAEDHKSDDENNSDSDLIEEQCVTPDSIQNTGQDSATDKVKRNCKMSDPINCVQRRQTTEAVSAPSNVVTAEKDSGVILITDESNKTINNSDKGLLTAEVSKINTNSEVICETVISQSNNLNAVANVNGAIKAKNENRIKVSQTELKKTSDKVQEEVMSEQSVIVCRTAAKGTEETAAVAVSDEAKNKTDCHLEEEKPLLRVRSFAKPPMTWKDECQKTDKPKSVLTVLKSHCDKNTNVTSKAPSSKNAAEGNGSQIRLIRIPSGKPQERGVNLENIVKKQKRLLTHLLRADYVYASKKPFNNCQQDVEVTRR